MEWMSGGVLELHRHDVIVDIKTGLSTRGAAQLHVCWFSKLFVLQGITGFGIEIGYLYLLQSFSFLVLFQFFFSFSSIALSLLPLSMNLSSAHLDC